MNARLILCHRKTATQPATNLGQLAGARATLAHSVAMLGEELDLEFLNQGGTIGFGNSP